MERADIAASLRLVAQEFEAGTIESVVCVTVTNEREPSSLAWPGDHALSLLGAVTLAKDFLSDWYENVAKERGLKG